MWATKKNTKAWKGNTRRYSPHAGRNQQREKTALNVSSQLPGISVKYEDLVIVGVWRESGPRGPSGPSGPAPAPRIVSVVY